MATYILFWNPAISSYTMERFQEDFDERGCVGNWSIYEHDDVEYGDIFYMVRCGEGKTGIVMRGEITSKCYEDSDWSPKQRKHIYYADIETSVTIDPETASVMLTPDVLTEQLPDFDWYGGHSGRRLSDEYAKKLDEIWFEYINSNPQLFSSNQAFIDDIYQGLLMNDDIKSSLRKKIGTKCEVCGYDYDAVFGADARKEQLTVPLSCIIAPTLKRLIYAVCPNCNQASDEVLAKKLNDK
jgi:hypothetical protein